MSPAKKTKHPKQPVFSLKTLFVFIVSLALVGAVYLELTGQAANPNLPGDVNNDNVVNTTDLSILTSHYGTTDTTADLNADAKTNILDLSKLLAHYGQTYNPSPPPTSSWPKYGISDGANIMIRSSADQDFELNQNKTVGAQILRLDYYQPSANDPVIQKALNLGFQVEIAIGGTSHAPGPGTASVASLATTAATKWKGKIRFYEIFNEPDLNGYTADTYVPYLKAAYTAIKAVDPNAIVWHAGMWNGNQATTFMIDWVAREYALGAKGYFDAFNFHCYGDINAHGTWQIWDMVYGSGGAGFYDSRNIRSVMNANGDSTIPIVCTEGGQGSVANYVTNTLKSADGIGTGYRKTKTMFIYTMMDDAAPGGFGMLDGSRNKRPSWTAYYNVVHGL